MRNLCTAALFLQEKSVFPERKGRLLGGCTQANSCVGQHCTVRRTMIVQLIKYVVGIQNTLREKVVLVNTVLLTPIVPEVSPAANLVPRSSTVSPVQARVRSGYEIILLQ